MNQGQRELSAADSTRLVYRYWLPRDDPKAVMAFLHGVGGHSGQPTYEYFVESLADSGRAAYGLDLRGFGLSGGKRGHVNRWRDYIDDVGLFLDEVRAENPGKPLFLFGQSLGGLIALEYAADTADHLDGVVVSAPAVTHRDVPAWLPAVVRTLARIAPTVSVDPKVDAAGFTRDAADVTRLQQDPLRYPRVTARFAAEFDDAVSRVLTITDQIKVPLLVLVGSADPVTPPDTSRRLLDLVGAEDKELKVYEGGYHQPILDIDREQVFDDIDTWLADHSVNTTGAN